MFIGIAGQMSAGKDVFANYLVDRLNVRLYKRFMVNPLLDPEHIKLLWSRVAFADGIKKLMSDVFGIDFSFIEEWKRKSEIPPGYLMTVRRALQFIGDGFRQIKPSVWIDLTLKYDTPRVISDCRYMNELKAIKEKGGINVLLYRPGFENDINHPSEEQIKQLFLNLEEQIGSPPKTSCKIDYPLIDYLIINDGSINDLYDKIDNIIIPYLEEIDVA